MGTSIKIEAIRDEKTTQEQWDLIREYFEESFNECENDEDYLNSGVIYCPYRNAYLESHISQEIKEKLKGSEISLYLYILEVEPDEVEVL